MIFALLRKESAVLAPYWFAGFALVVVSGFLQATGTDVTLDPLSHRIDGGEVANFIVFLLSFSIGYTAVAPEFTEGQIEFLDSLPTARWSLFFIKTFAAVLPCLAIVGGSLAADSFLALVSPGPPGTTVLPTLIFGHGVFLTGALAGLGLGMLLSWLRGLAWGVLTLGMVVGLFGGLLFPPLQSYVPLFGTWGTIEFAHGQPIHPTSPLLVWSVVGLLSIGLSFLLFLGPGERLTRQGSWATGGVRIGVSGCLSLLVLSLGAICLLGLLFRAPDLIFNGVQITSTEHFRVLYRGSDAAAVQAESSDIEALSTEVGEWVGNTEPIALDVEFLGAAANHGGVFTGGKIRLRTDADRATLAHELAHAHAFAIEGPAAWLQRHHMRFFDEGLASWVASRTAGNPRIPKFAAAIHAVDPVEFDLLVEDERFQEERDLAQAYPIGEAFVEALDPFGGEKTRACVLRTAGEIGGEPIAGLALWVLIADRCDFEIDRVVQRMEALLEERAQSLPKLPQLEASVSEKTLRVHTTQVRFPILCRFRDNIQAEVTHYVHVWAREGQCEIPLWRLSGTTFDYQVGFQIDDETVFDRWETAPLP